MFRAVKVTRNTYSGKNSYWWYGIGFDSCSLFRYPSFELGKNVALFGVGKSSLVHTGNKKKGMLVIRKGLT